MTELITRQFVVRDIEPDTRVVTGIAVPYGQTVAVGGGISERFEAGAIDNVENVKLFYGHGEPIGLVTKGEDTEDGFYIEARISDTPKGNEVYTLLKDNVLNRFSVGFIPVEDRWEDDNTVIVRTKVDLREVSVVPFPAYDGASVLAVREDGSKVRKDENTNERGTIEGSTNNMSDEVFAKAADLDEIRSAQSELDRAIAEIKSGSAVTNDAAASQFRSAGEAVKALLSGDSNAVSEWRAVQTSTSSHAANQWKGVLTGIAQGKRPLANIFGVSPLPAEGNTVEYGAYAVSGAAASQASEGATLSELTISTSVASTPVRTFGVQSSLSRQVIERSDIAFLDDNLQAQAASYANVTNAYIRSQLTGAAAQAGAGFTLSSATGKDFYKAVIDAAQKIDALNLGLAADAVVVSSDVFFALATTVDTSNRPVFDVNGDGSNTFGAVRGLAGYIFNVPVVMDAGLAAKSMYVVSSQAVRVWENAGAPTALQDENITNLTKVFALYGYLAAGVANANAIVKPAIA